MAVSNGPLSHRLNEGSVKIELEAQDWQPTETPGFYVKPVFSDAARNESTLLMKMDAGAYAPSHSHDLLEEIFVLSGDFYDDEHSYGPGDYCQRAIGAMHAAGSKSGGVVLLTYR